MSTIFEERGQIFRGIETEDISAGTWRREHIIISLRSVFVS